MGVVRLRCRRARRGRGALRAYVFAPEERLVAITLWTAYSHVFDCFGISPILDISSPTKRCGKSTTIVVARHSMPGAALEREHHACRVVPGGAGVETDALDRRGGHVRENERRAARHPQRRAHARHRVRGAGGRRLNEPRLFSTWAPKIVAAIGRLPDTIEDRSIRVALTRKPVGAKRRDAFDPGAQEETAEPVATQARPFRPRRPRRDR